MFLEVNDAVCSSFAIPENENNHAQDPCYKFNFYFCLKWLCVKHQQ